MRFQFFDQHPASQPAPQRYGWLRLVSLDRARPSGGIVL